MPSGLTQEEQEAWVEQQLAQIETAEVDDGANDNQTGACADFDDAPATGGDRAALAAIAPDVPNSGCDLSRDADSALNAAVLACVIELADDGLDVDPDCDPIVDYFERRFHPLDDTPCGRSATS